MYSIRNVIVILLYTSKIDSTIIFNDNVVVWDLRQH